MRSFEFALKRENGELVEVNGGYVKAYPKAKIPEYATKGSAGADFFCAKSVVIPSIWRMMFKCIKDAFKSDKLLWKEKMDKKLVQPTLVHTGIKSNMQDDEVLYLYNRSSNPMKLGLVLANGVGVVDSDYYNNVNNDGEIMFAFYNFMPWDVTLMAGDKVGQGVFSKFLRATNAGVKDCDRVGGIGSTDEQ